MTIASVFWARNARTGAHERLLHLLRGLSERGHRVFLFTKAGYTFEKEGITTVELREGWIPSQKLDALRALLVRSEVETKKEIEDVDLVISFGLGSAVPGMYVKRGFDAPMLLGLRAHPVENVVVQGALRQSVRRFVTSLYLRMVLQEADCVIMQTEVQREKIVRDYSFRKERVSVVKNNILGDIEQPTESDRAENILFVGTLNHRKGIDTLLRAVSYLGPSTEIHLDVAGKGPMKDDAERFVEKNALGHHVTFHGYVHNIRAMMRRADLVVIPSRFDSFPNVGLEAMGVGTPFIVSDLADVRSAFGCVTQYIPPGNPERLAEKIASLQDPDQYRELREQCMSHRSGFDFDWVGAFESEIRRLV
jgi:glycosyltransferase involved in cell wall biosynthesis